MRERGILLPNASMLVFFLNWSHPATAFDRDLQAAVGIEKLAQIVQCTAAEFIVEYFEKPELNGKNYAQD